MIIRDATAQDLPGILAIYNDVIATSTAVYAYDPVSLADRTQWLAALVLTFCNHSDTTHL